MFNNIQVFVKGIVIDENNNHVVMLSDKEENKSFAYCYRSGPRQWPF